MDTITSEISSEAMQTQLISVRSRSTMLRTDRPAVACPSLAQHAQQGRTAIAHTEGVVAFGMSDVPSTAVDALVKGYARIGDVTGNRLGSPAWSPPV